MSRLSARWLILSATFVAVVAACASSDEAGAAMASVGVQIRV